LDSPDQELEPELEEENPLASSSLLGDTQPFEPRPNPVQGLLERLKLNERTTMTSKDNKDVDMDAEYRSREVKLNPPKPFTGKRESLKKFLQDAELYITINKKTYDEDIKKIGFILSYMNDGDAATWKEQFIDDCYTKSTAAGHSLDLGTYANFKTELEKAFKPWDSPGEALDQMKNL
jgi:hypothetical protein